MHSTELPQFSLEIDMHFDVVETFHTVPLKPPIINAKNKNITIYLQQRKAHYQQSIFNPYYYIIICYDLHYMERDSFYYPYIFNKRLFAA